MTMSNRVLTPQDFKPLRHQRLLLMSYLRRVLKLPIMETMRGGFSNGVRRHAHPKQLNDIRLFPQPGYQWRKPVAVSKLADPLVSRGFTDLGPYRIDVMPEVSVRLSETGKAVTAKGADPDTLVASAKAYLGALNKLVLKRQRGKPEAMVTSAPRLHSTDAV